MLCCLIVAVLFCIGNLLNSRQRKSFFDVVKEGRSRTIKVSSGYSSIKVYRWFFGFGALALIDLSVGLNMKYWFSPDPNSMRWLGLFTNKTFRKHRKLIFPHGDFIIWLHLLSVFGNISSAFFHPHFIIRIFPSAFY